MRKESDSVGPKAELEHWKKRMAKFNCLLDELKSQKCKAVIGVLLVSKSRYVKVRIMCTKNSYPYFGDPTTTGGINMTSVAIYDNSESKLGNLRLTLLV